MTAAAIPLEADESSALLDLRAREAMSGAGPLLERFIEEGDEAAFRELVLHYGPMVTRICHKVTRNRHAAEDAAQTVFLALTRRARNGEVDPGCSLDRWLRGAAYRCAMKIRGTLERRRSRECHMVDEPIGEDHVEPAALRDESHARLREELARLPDDLRLPFTLCYWHGLTNEEAAARLGWPVGTIKTRLARGRKELARRLGPE